MSRTTDLLTQSIPWEFGALLVTANSSVAGVAWAFMALKFPSAWIVVAGEIWIAVRCLGFCLKPVARIALGAVLGLAILMFSSQPRTELPCWLIGGPLSTRTLLFLLAAMAMLDFFSLWQSSRRKFP